MIPGFTNCPKEIFSHVWRLFNGLEISAQEIRGIGISVIMWHSIRPSAVLNSSVFISATLAASYSSSSH